MCIRDRDVNDQPIASNDDFCSVQSQITAALEPGNYTIAVSGYSASSGNYTLSYSASVSGCGSPPEVPTVVSFTATHSSIFLGELVTLSWVTNAAETVAVDGHPRIDGRGAGNIITRYVHEDDDIDGLAIGIISKHADGNAATTAFARSFEDSVFVAVASHFWLRDRLDRLTVAAIAVSLAGGAFLAFGEWDGASRRLLGDVLARTGAALVGAHPPLLEASPTLK